MTMLRHGMTPKMKPLGARQSAVVAVLDVGTTKVAALIARLEPADAREAGEGRSHRMRVLGIGHQRSRGMKGGIVIDMDEAERAVRHAMDAAERMAGVQVESVILSITGGRIASQGYAADIAIAGKAVSDRDVARVMDQATAHALPQNRAVLHATPTGFFLDSSRHVRDPRGMVGTRLGVDMHVATVEAAAARNLMLVVERCHLAVDALVASPYASALAVVAGDEADLGCVALDLGGGTSSAAVFAHGHMIHLDAIAVGGHHVTLDIARGLGVRVDDAERLKIISGSCLDSAADERDMIAISPMGEDERSAMTHVPKGQLTRIIKPRVEEILELMRDRLRKAGFGEELARGIVLTGGASQLTGLRELAQRVLGRQVRCGRPADVKGLPESARSPAFAGAMGLLAYPQVAGLDHVEPARGGAPGATGTDGYLARMGRWLKDSF
jgi:cell division protein FtsA